MDLEIAPRYGAEDAAPLAEERDGRGVGGASDQTMSGNWSVRPGAEHPTRNASVPSTNVRRVAGE